MYGYDVTYALDALEPLATAFAFRYMNAGGVSTELVVWKEHVRRDLPVHRRHHLLLLVGGGSVPVLRVGHERELEDARVRAVGVRHA